MPSSLGHALAGLAAAAALRPPALPRPFWALAAACAVLPDLDALGRPFGLGDVALLGGHRALTHSLAGAAALGAAATWLAARGPRSDGRDSARLRLWACFALAAASHGFLDAFTTYGEGVAFLAPFSSERFASPWQPIGLGPGRGGPGRALVLMADEFLWVGLLALLPAGLVVLARRGGRRVARPVA